MNRFILTFMFLLVALFTLEMLMPVQTHVIVPFTEILARISMALVLPFDDSVIAYGKVLQFTDTGFAVSIEAGCNGVEATIVLIAAVVAFPAPWKARIAAIALGFGAVQSLNIVRIISLFYLGDWNADIFEFVHKFVWPTLIMLDVLVVFILYLRYLNGSPAGDGNAHAA
ncbi:MAG: exosortase H [Gammaproteobacteria bacterium]|nr:exosortase H [Gammaproteobacteria bacterium]